MTDDERRARRSEALAAAREAGRDNDRRGEGETDRVPERRETPRQRETGGDRRQDDGRRDGDRDERGRPQDGDGRGRRDNDGRQPSGQHRDRVSAVDHEAVLVTAFEHDGYDCELGRVGDNFFGFVQVPPDHDRLHLMWELDVPGEFGYGPDADGWVGFDTRPIGRKLSPREAAMALAGLAAQVAERSRSRPE